MECIKAKAMVPKARNALTRDLVVHMYSYGGRPSRALCQHAARRLTLKYPFMRDALGTGYASWEQKLVERVYNVEKGHRKRATGDSSSLPKTKKRKKDQYPPVITHLSDEATHQRHAAALKKELEKPRPRKDVLLELMKGTFSRRRQNILSDEWESVTDVLENYPALKNPDVLLQEMELILDKEELFSKFQTDWLNKWIPAIISCSQSRHIDLSVDSALDDDDDDDIRQVHTLKALSKLFTILPRRDIVKGIKLIKYFFESYDVSTLPDTVAVDVTSPKLGRFVCEGQNTYYIFIEGVILCSCNSFTKGFYLWFCSHYVFNLSYHKYNHDVAMFIQEFVIGLPKSQKKSANYLTVVTEIVNMTK